MKSYYYLIFAFAANAVFSQTPAPTVPAGKAGKPPATTSPMVPLAFSEIVLSKEQGDEEGGACRVIAKVTNNGPDVVVRPTLRISIGPGPGSEIPAASAFIIAPHETKFFHAAGQYLSRAELDAAHEAKVFEKFTGSNRGSVIDHEVKVISQLSFTNTSFTYTAENRHAYVKGEFRNSSGAVLKLVAGTAAFLDQDGHLLDAGTFVYDPAQPMPEQGIDTGFEAPEAAHAVRCVMQVDQFEEQK